MRAIFETGFYYLYLVFIIGVGLYLAIKKKNRLFGVACVILGFGDAFHLIPRAIGLYTNTLDNPNETLAFWLGFGKLITSATMTIFYVLIYLFIYEKNGKSRNKYLDIAVSVLYISRLILCIFPQNEWLTNGNNLVWGICRNIPFVLLGGLVVYLLIKNLKEVKYLRWIWILIIFSFLFYLAVVIFAAKYSWVGMMMLPKTVCYIWIGVYGLLNAIKSQDEYNDK